MAVERAHSDRLKELMSSVGLKSYRALAREAGVSLWQIEQLRSGRGDRMRLSVLSRLAGALDVSLSSLLQLFELLQGGGGEGESARQLETLRQEYARLQEALETRVELGRSQVKDEALQTLESWLVQWPTIARRAAENEGLKAVKVLPFVRPVEALVEQWGVVAIAPVDAEVDYDPQMHQLAGGTTAVGEKVRVTHSGCLYNGKLLHRAKVKVV